MKYIKPIFENESKYPKLSEVYDLLLPFIDDEILGEYDTIGIGDDETGIYISKLKNHLNDDITDAMYIRFDTNEQNTIQDLERILNDFIKPLKERCDTHDFSFNIGVLDFYQADSSFIYLEKK